MKTFLLSSINWIITYNTLIYKLNNEKILSDNNDHPLVQYLHMNQTYWKHIENILKYFAILLSN